MPDVNPEILRWARETAGLTEDEAVAHLHLGDARGVPAVERLKALENGETPPSRPMLVKMAKQYRRPLLTFYLTAPPPRGNRGQDFRTLPLDQSATEEAILDALIRGVQARQGLVRSALLDEDDVHPLAFIGSCSLSNGVHQVVASLRRTTNLTLDDYRGARDIDEAFQLVRSHTEEAGVFVLLLGNLGSHHTNIGLETFRGFALADDIAPFIVINDQDHHGAWSFTLLHELTHLFLGQTGVSGGAPDREVEKFCNDVASELLLPSTELNQLRGIGTLEVEETIAIIAEFAVPRNVSLSMVAYKLYRIQAISRRRWQSLQHQFRERWLEDRDYRRARSQRSEGGPNYYVVRRHRLGPALVEVTARLLAAGALTTSKAGAVLGVKPKNVQNLISEYRVGVS